MTQEEALQSRTVRRSYWICSGPLFESSVFIVPGITLDSETGDPLPGTEVQPFSLSLTFIDADGEIVSENQISISRFGPTILELGQFMESFKTEGGLRHGTMLIEGTPGWTCELRLHSIKSAAFMAPVAPLSDSRGTFLPISFSPECSHLTIVTNEGLQEAKVRCRLYLGKRSPEHVLNVPGRGARVLGVEAVFADYLEALGDDSLQAYLRLTTRSEEQLGVQMVERTASKRETGIFGVIG